MKNKPYRYYIYLLLKAAIGLVQLLPRTVGLQLARFLGWAAFILVSRQREKTLTNLRTAFGQEKTEKEIRRIARAVFQNLAMTLTDLIFLKKFNRENLNDFIDTDGIFEHSRTLLKEGKGAIFLSGHIGNWELLGAIFTIVGFTGGVVGKRIYYEKYNELIVNNRLAKGVRTFYQDGNPRELLRELKQGGVIGVVADQDVEKLEGVYVDYFGQPSYTPLAPVRLAQISQAPILIGALIREGNRYRVVYDPEPLRVPRDLDEKGLVFYTEKWSKSLEQLIRQYPEQWVWMHDRWKTKIAASPNPSTQLRAGSQASSPEARSLKLEASLSSDLRGGVTC